MTSTVNISRADFDSYVIVVDADCEETPALDVAGGPCTLYNVHIENTNATKVYVKLYDSLNPTVGTTDPVEIYEVPASATFIGDMPVNPPDGLPFTYGLSLACVQEAGTAGTTDPGTNAVKVVLTLKKGVE